MRRRTQRAERHRAGAESLGDSTGGLDLFEGHRIAADKIKETAQGRLTACLVVRQCAELPERRVAVALRRVLELRDRHRIPVVMLALHAVLELATRIQPGDGLILERGAVTTQRFLGDELHPDAADARRCAREMSIDERRVKPDCFPQLRAAVTL